MTVTINQLSTNKRGQDTGLINTISDADIINDTNIGTRPSVPFAESHIRCPVAEDERERTEEQSYTYLPQIYIHVYHMCTDLLSSYFVDIYLV